MIGVRGHTCPHLLIVSQCIEYTRKSMEIHKREHSVVGFQHGAVIAKACRTVIRFKNMISDCRQEAIPPRMG